MAMSRPLLPMLLLSLLATPGRAQRLSPVAPRAATADMSAGRLRADVRPMARTDTVPEPDDHINTARAVVGGVLGAALGAVAGIWIGSLASTECTGDLCGLEGAVVGLAIGEPLGLAIGAHVGSGSRRHGNVAVTALTSATVLVGGAFMGAGLERLGGVGAVMIPLTPVLQLVTAVAIERY